MPPVEIFSNLQTVWGYSQSSSLKWKSTFDCWRRWIYAQIWIRRLPWLCICDSWHSQRKTVIQWDEKVSARSRFFDTKFDGFWQFYQKVLKLLKSFIPHFKALIFSSLELQVQRARPPNKASTPSWMKLKLFLVKGALFGCLVLCPWSSKELNIRALKWAILKLLS